jgi:hypothetical protein
MGDGIPVNVSVDVLDLLGNTLLFPLWVPIQIGFINVKVKGSKISHLFGTFNIKILSQEEKRQYKKENFCYLPLHTRNNDAIPT